MRPHSLTSLQDQSRPMKRSKTTHVAGSSMAAPMMRTSRSSISRPRPTPIPFVGKGPSYPTTPVVLHSLPTAGPGRLGDYLHPGQAQYSPNLLVPASPVVAEASQHDEGGREMAIDDYLSMHEDDLYPLASPINIPQSARLSFQEPDQYPSSSLPSVCGSMVSGPTLETAMSRCSSSLNDGTSISGQFNEMVRIQSGQSAQSYARHDGFRSHHPLATHPPLAGKRFSEDSGLGAMGEDAFAYTYLSYAPTHSAPPPHQHPMEISTSQSSLRSTSSAGLSPHDLGQHLHNMERSVSKDSIKSNSSLQLRAKEVLARQNISAMSRHLQPKPAAGPATQEVSDSLNSSATDGKAAIAKTKYERPKHPKVLCNQCNEHLEGFRGEHELRRHTEAKHKSMVKKWICRDPSDYGIPHSETAVKLLRDCKQCSQQKPYGAYYNAAAHLRRTHFKVKPPKSAPGPKNGQTKVEEEKEKRGGKGGGDWPSMAELKLWMVEVTLPMDQDGALAPDGPESVGAVDPEDAEDEFVNTQYGAQVGIPQAMGLDGFDMAAFAGVGAAFGSAISLTGASFPGELDSQLSDLYPGFPVSALPVMPISSAGFDYRNSDLSVQQGMAMSLDSHGYTSPVSSTATITQAGVCSLGQILPHTTLLAPHDDVAELPFDMAFPTGCQ